MVALADLQPASFRGARFLVPKDHAEEGPNIIVHRYPDSGNTYAEYNGQHQPDFHVSAVIHGAGLLGQFEALKSALNVPAPGTLHHPWYGSQYCAVKGPWKVVREDKDSGVLHLEITFCVTGPPLFPGLVSGIAGLVTGLSAEFLGSLFSLFSSTYGSPALSIGSLGVLASAVQDVASTFNAAMESVSAVSIAAGHLDGNPERYLTDGTTFGSELYNLFRGPFEDTTYSGDQIVLAMQAVDFAAQRAATVADAITPSTTDYTIRQSSLVTFSTFVRLACLSSLAEAMAGTVYTTADAVHASEDLLLSLYASIPAQSLPSDTGLAISKVVSSALAVLRKLELQLPRIGSQYVEDRPASVLAYYLYDTDERTGTLVDLNLPQNPIAFERDVNVLTGVG